MVRCGDGNGVDVFVFQQLAIVDEFLDIFAIGSFVEDLFIAIAIGNDVVSKSADVTASTTVEANYGAADFFIRAKYATIGGSGQRDRGTSGAA